MGVHARSVAPVSCEGTLKPCVVARLCGWTPDLTAKILCGRFALNADGELSVRKSFCLWTLAYLRDTNTLLPELAWELALASERADPNHSRYLVVGWHRGIATTCWVTGAGLEDQASVRRALEKQGFTQEASNYLHPADTLLWDFLRAAAAQRTELHPARPSKWT